MAKNSAVKATKTPGGHAALLVAKPKTKTNVPPTPAQKDVVIQKERAVGKAELKKKAPGAEFRGQHLVGHEGGALAWITNAVCQFFKLEAVGFQKNVTLWNFPTDLEDKKKKHQVARKFYYQIGDKFLMVDVFDAGTQIEKINLIKAWLEKLGFRYTYVLGGEGVGEDTVTDPTTKKPRKKTQEELESDMAKFLDLLFKKRLEMLDPKAEGYPKFKVPLTYKEAGMPY